jgi:hypothetical protein
MRAEAYQRRREELAGWPVGIASYRLGAGFICEIDDAGSGAQIARAEGPTRDAAESQAVATAEGRLARTRVREVD